MGLYSRLQFLEWGGVAWQRGQSGRHVLEHHPHAFVQNPLDDCVLRGEMMVDAAGLDAYPLGDSARRRRLVASMSQQPRAGVEDVARGAALPLWLGRRGGAPRLDDRPTNGFVPLFDQSPRYFFMLAASHQ